MQLQSEFWFIIFGPNRNEIASSITVVISNLYMNIYKKRKKINISIEYLIRLESDGISKAIFCFFVYRPFLSLIVFKDILYKFTTSSKFIINPEYPARTTNLHITFKNS